MSRFSCSSRNRRSVPYYGMPDYVLICGCSTVPTNDQILVPETLLKKRKSQEKARAERTEATNKKRAVCIPRPAPRGIMMHNTTFQLDTLDAVDYTFFRV